MWGPQLVPRGRELRKGSDGSWLHFGDGGGVWGSSTGDGSLSPAPTAEMAQSSLQAWQTGSEEGPQLALQGAFPSAHSRHTLCQTGNEQCYVTTSQSPCPPPLLQGWGTPSISPPPKCFWGDPSSFDIHTMQLLGLFVENWQKESSTACRKRGGKSSAPGDRKPSPSQTLGLDAEHFLLYSD